MPDDPAAPLRPERHDQPGPTPDGGESQAAVGKDPPGQEPDGQREDGRGDPEDADAPAAGGATPAYRPEAGGGAHETRPLSAARGDETRPLAAPGGDDETRSLTPQAGPPPRRENWSARARVPTRPAAGGAGGSWAGQADWERLDEDRGHWWMPIVVGLLGFLLIGVLTVGVWLISTAQDEKPGKVTPTAPATAPPTAAHPTTMPPRTTAEPSPAVEPSPVTLPDLVGVSAEEAEARLERLGLTYRVTYQPSFEEPGTVLSTDPEAGTDVEAGAEVVLSVAQALLPTERPTTPTSGTRGHPIRTPAGWKPNSTHPGDRTAVRDLTGAGPARVACPQVLAG